MLKIKRKSLLYKSGVEYADFCLNHVEGCSHGCKFPCYAFNMAKRFGKVQTYAEWIKPKLVENSLELLDKVERNIYYSDILSGNKLTSLPASMKEYFPSRDYQIDIILSREDARAIYRALPRDAQLALRM